jgi:hypothetical protein
MENGSQTPASGRKSVDGRFPHAANGRPERFLRTLSESRRREPKPSVSIAGKLQRSTAYSTQAANYDGSSPEA